MVNKDYHICYEFVYRRTQCMRLNSAPAHVCYSCWLRFCRYLL